MEYTANDVLRLAKRVNNPKRSYLLVNPLQGKHMPVQPGASLHMMRAFGRMLAEKYPETRLVVGFAETATAIGAAVAACFPGDCRYMHTTREAFPDITDWVEFREEHSHAAEQKLFRTGLTEAVQHTDTILFIEDEISTGRTLVNMICQLRTLIPGAAGKKIVAASIINRLSAENEQLLRNVGIECDWLVRIPSDDYAAEMARMTVAPAAEVDGEALAFTRLEKPCAYPNPRLCVPVDAYRRACETLAEAALAQLSLPEGARVLVLGAEECMYPALIVGEKLEDRYDVRCHATTRSPIGVGSGEGYPITEGWRIPSFYEEGRVNFIYNLAEYDAALIVTDSPWSPERALPVIAKALHRHGDCPIYYLGCADEV